MNVNVLYNLIVVLSDYCFPLFMAVLSEKMSSTEQNTSLVMDLIDRRPNMCLKALTDKLVE